MATIHIYSHLHPLTAGVEVAGLEIVYALCLGNGKSQIVQSQIRQTPQNASSYLHNQCLHFNIWAPDGQKGQHFVGYFCGLSFLLFLLIIIISMSVVFISLISSSDCIEKKLLKWKPGYPNTIKAEYIRNHNQWVKCKLRELT